MEEKELINKINGIVSTHFGVDVNSILPTFNIKTILMEGKGTSYASIDYDSFQRFRLLLGVISREFNIDIDLDLEVVTFQDLYSFVAKKFGMTLPSSITGMVSKLRRYHNGSDCLVYPNISDSVLQLIRFHFNIDRKETIILIRDTSLWDSRDQGLVITDEGLYYINDNESRDGRFYVDWGDVDHVEYQENVLYFKDANNDEPAQYGIGCFVKYPDKNDGSYLARVFTQMASCVSAKEDPVEKYVSESRKIAQNGNVNEAVNRLNNVLDNVSDSVKPYIYYNIADILYQNGDYKKAIDNCISGLDTCEPGSYVTTLFKTIRFSAKEKQSDFMTARKDCLDVMLHASDQEWNGERCKQIATNKFNSFDEKYVSHFLSLSYNVRKVLMPVNEYVDLNQSRVSVIRKDNLPAIKFPMGHPIANQLYVGHPFIPSKYIPFENYQLELVEDKVREFCMLAQSLGATEISIECLNASASNESGRNQQNISGEAGNRLLKGKGEYHQDRSRQMIDELSHSICIHQTFTPCNKPSIPETMVWYDDEPSWQRLVSQRLSGGLTSHEERIETKKSQMVDGRELTELKAEVNSLYVDMKMSISEEEEAKFTQQENAVLAIKVKFAPINQLTGAVIESNSNLGGTVKEKFNTLGKIAKKMSSNIVDTIKTASSLTSSEEKYLKELKDLLADGEISSRERRLLEKIRIQLGISEDRSVELENSLTTPALTPEEQEYFDEYQGIIAEGNISDRDQRFLDKLKKANNISEERAKEIEKMVCS